MQVGMLTVCVDKPTRQCSQKAQISVVTLASFQICFSVVFQTYAALKYKRDLMSIAAKSWITNVKTKCYTLN